MGRLFLGVCTYGRCASHTLQFPHQRFGGHKPVFSFIQAADQPLCSLLLFPRAAPLCGTKRCTFCFICITDLSAVNYSDPWLDQDICLPLFSHRLHRISIVQPSQLSTFLHLQPSLPLLVDTQVSGIRFKLDSCQDCVETHTNRFYLRKESCRCAACARKGITIRPPR